MCKLARTKAFEPLSLHLEKQLAAVEAVRQARDLGQQELAFGSRPFLLCALPIRKPPRGKLTHVRRNGKLVLEIVAHPDYGLPFGQDRLIPIWVATEAVRQKSRFLSFRCAADLLRAFDLPLDGQHYRRLADGFKRVFTSTFYFGAGDVHDRDQIWSMNRIHFFDELELWCTKKSLDSIASENCPNSLVLSERFWQEIQQHPVPVDLGVVRALVNNPGCLDFYTWLSWRCFVCRRDRESVPLFGPRGLCSQLGVEAYSRPRNFRKRIREWLRIVRLYWPECPAKLPEAADCLELGKPQVPAVRMRG